MAKPIVDGIEAGLRGNVDVIRLDLLSEFGRATAGQFGVQAVPTIVLIDGAGSVRASFAGIPNHSAITAAALALLPESDE